MDELYIGDCLPCTPLIVELFMFLFLFKGEVFPFVARPPPGFGVVGSKLQRETKLGGQAQELTAIIEHWGEPIKIQTIGKAITQ